MQIKLMSASGVTGAREVKFVDTVICQERHVGSMILCHSLMNVYLSLNMLLSSD